MHSFFVMLMGLGTVVSLLQWVMYKSAFMCLQNKWSYLLFWVPTMAFALINAYPRVLPLALTRVLAWATGLYFAFFYYSALLGVIFLMIKIFSHVAHTPQVPIYLVKGGFVFILLLIVGGWWNATHHVYREVNFTTAKPLTKDLKIAFVADLHLGPLFGTSVNEKMVEEINAVQPDLVLIGGDIVDSDLKLVLAEGSLAPLKNLKTNLGVYAVYGNHDVMRGTDGKEKEYLQTLGLNFVRNETVPLGTDLVLTGLDDFSRSRNAYDFAPAPSTKVALFMEHQPRSIERAAAKGYDLSFAGHTHAGQFYPNREITKRMYSLDYGSKYFGQMLATVTNGYGLWGIPIRVGPAPEIVVLNIKKK